ncbi:hypothetical protein SAMD00079811_36980 [Scytonema sp. HK-05]|nr:hypothetical protein SAMD00079811_36980 [Scytonema sp. HK-05]
MHTDKLSAYICVHLRFQISHYRIAATNVVNSSQLLLFTNIAVRTRSKVDQRNNEPQMDTDGHR